MSKEEILTEVDNLVTDVEFKVSDTSYKSIKQNIIDTWPEWKRELCNEELIISVNSEKL